MNLPEMLGWYQEVPGNTFEKMMLNESCICNLCHTFTAACSGWAAFWIKLMSLVRMPFHRRFQFWVGKSNILILAKVTKLICFPVQVTSGSI
jgi:hypothetical protein